METVAFLNPRGQRLVASRAGPHPGAVVLLAHGFTSDRRSRGRFVRLAEALAERGVGSLAFDFAGCGESDDQAFHLCTLTGDLESALEWVRARGASRLALLGHSLGGLVALRACPPDLATLVLTGAPTGPMRYTWSEVFPAEQLAQAGQRGTLTLTREEGPRRTHVIDARLLEEFEQIDPGVLLPRVRCPTLLVCGDGDAEERQVLEHAQSALPHLPPGSRLEVVPGAPHGFGAHYERVAELVVPWLAEQLLRT